MIENFLEFPGGFGAMMCGQIGKATDIGRVETVGSVFLTGCCGSTRRIIRASASILPRSGREGLGKRTNEGTVPDSAAVLIVLAPNASAGNLPFSSILNQ